jgi:putative nucleotidyltransferase with HDIG domain
MEASSEEIMLCLFQTVGVLVDAAGMRESHAPGHRLRTSQIARTIAQLLGFEADDIDGIRMAATLHDVGNILLPPGLLAKPDRFTAAELAIMQQHVAHGAEILKNIEFPWPVVPMISQHHERLDGSGYPNGLKGGEIMLEAQILGVADAMEAMTSPRPWREALPVEAAIEEIIKGRGITFDPFAVDTCVELFTNQAHRLDPEYYGRE